MSDHFPRVVGTADEPWPLAAGSVYPVEREEELADLRVHPADIDGATLQAFVPQGADVDQSADRSLEEVALILAETASVHAVATGLLEHDPCDMIAVRYPGIGKARRRFMAYRPPRLPQIPERDFSLCREVLAGIYRFHDLLLGRVLELAGPDATIVLASDHGYHRGHLRPFRANLIEEEWRRSAGIFLAAGPGLKRDARVSGACLLDIVPTLLTLLGLPVGRDMEGRPLVDAYVEAPGMGVRATWGPDPVPPDEAVQNMATREVPTELIAALADLAA